MKINNDNYYSVEVDKEYMSYSQYKSFLRCAYQAMGYLNGKIKYPINDSMIIGSLVDAYFEGKESYQNYLDKNKDELFQKNGKMYSKFLIHEDMIKTLETDSFCMQYMTGIKQYIIDTKWLGVLWKAKLDVLGDTFITDLKTTKEISNGQFIKDYGYIGQLALYSELYKIQTSESNRKDLYIVAVTSEKQPDKEVYHISNEENIKTELNTIQQNLEWILQVKEGKQEPIRCGKCFYCKSRKQLFTAVEI